MRSRRPWARRTAVTTVSAAALVALALPAEAATTTAGTSTTTATAAAAAVDYATWQADCQAVMNQALPYLKARIAAPGPGEKQAIVLDIDNTTLETDFGFSYPSPANKPVLEVAKYAQQHGVSLFFVTARPGIIASVTDYNLKHVGYQVNGLYVRGFIDLFKDVAVYKTAQRVDIENKGYTIIANIGNSATDLSGGHAEKTFKLPDYDGQLS
ncbi:putative secreted acid phosphatase [Streptomyces sp. SAI-208]|uniref:HAD family acid phosphatase n=1 Tax=unclassified Streptomyces TaxID=2593676 RepID=UPI002473798A|nr:MULTISPECIES: HAD family acid phosphatase [unclassified Streptomyces]MDH6517390.1 putative secreted acid phosphatase [Streptomyces sp. SAI-090]MDH6549612.1 putative secreted acid phosphatase [Streptomyces sp. SAI-041]MDH6568669.1 putative secreted acid phosphatase [Streptomyces sp. SAI-117]MDH6586382.1 putative secreted acid phosphatase [Streptomyces sp. SAI-133]MDH6608206.1 putative secreted acid phosphatase [Streptomyces sp. SAI-208]